MSISDNSAMPEEIARSVEKVRGLMETLWQSLDSLCEGVSFSAPDDVRQLLALRAGVVPLIDARLAACGDLLRRGLRSEALGRADELPPLVETAELLDLSQHQNWSTWRVGLTAQQMPEPVKPRLDLVAALKRAREEVQRLKPRLDRWRRINLSNAGLPEKIELLRKLRKADPSNEVWVETLREHENQRMMQIETDIRQATCDRDEPRLNVLVEELGASWVEAKPARLLGAATAALESFRGSRIDRELDEVGASLAAAHEARDLDAARELRRRWQPLADEKAAADPGDARLMAAAPAVAWVDNHDRMRALSDEVWQSLDAKPGGLRAWRQWVRGLGRMGAEMEDLAEKLPGEVDVEAVQRSLERIARKQYELDRHEAFRRKLMYIAAGSAAVVLAAGVWWFEDWRRYRLAVADAVTQLDQHIEECRVGGGSDPSEFIESLEDRVRRHPTVAGKLASLEGCVSKDGDRRRRFAEQLEETKALTAAAAGRERNDQLAPWPAEFAKATVTIDQIAKESLAKSAGERGDVERAAGAIQDLAKRWTAAADLDLDRRAAAINGDLDEARQALATDVAAADARLTKAKAEIEAARSLAETPATTGATREYAVRRVGSAATVARFGVDGPLARKAAELQRMVTGRRTFFGEVAKMPGLLGRWREYGQLLDGVARTHGDNPQAADFAEAMQRLPQWEAVTAWTQFVVRLPPLERATPKQAKDVIAEFKALPQTARDLPPGKRFAAEVIPALEAFAAREFEPLREDLQTWFDGTFQRELAWVVTDVAGKRYYCLDPAPAVGEKFEHVTGWRGGNLGWVSKKSTVPAENVKPSPQFRLADKISDQFSKGAIESGLNLDDQLLGAIGQTLADKDIDPLLQLVAAFKYCRLASSLSRPVQDQQPTVMGLFGSGGLPGGFAIQELTTFVDPDRDKNAAYLAAGKAAREIVQQVRAVLPKLVQAVAVERAALAGAKGEVPDLVGSMTLAAGGVAEPAWLGRKPELGPVWWISSATEFAEAGRVERDGTFKPATKPAPAGTPLWRLGPPRAQATEAKTR
jgi:hypothetical protein